MNCQESHNKHLNLTIFMRDGTKKDLTENVCDGSGDIIDLKMLCQSIQSIQTRCNNILTEIVEQERETTPQTNSHQTSQDEEDDDDDDCDNESDDNNCEPPEKLQKT